MTETEKDRARSALEDGVYRCLEAGMTVGEILNEVEYALENAEDET